MYVTTKGLVNALREDAEPVRSTTWAHHPWFVEHGACGVWQDNDVPGSTDRDRITGVTSVRWMLRGEHGPVSVPGV